MTEGARRADRDDLPRLTELFRAALAQLSAGRGGALLAEHRGRSEPAEQSLLRALDDPSQGVWVGTVDDHIVGYATARIETLPGGTVLGAIEELFVVPGGRGVGVGEALMDALLAWFVDRGCTGVDSVALPGDRLSKNFFESSGFKARLIVMHRELPTRRGRPERPARQTAAGAKRRGRPGRPARES